MEAKLIASELKCPYCGSELEAEQLYGPDGQLAKGVKLFCPNCDYAPETREEFRQHAAQQLIAQIHKLSGTLDHFGVSATNPSGAFKDALEILEEIGRSQSIDSIFCIEEDTGCK